MPEIGTAFVGVSMFFGVAMGFILGLRPEDRTPTLFTTVVCALIGLVAWLIGGPEAETAGSAMAIGGTFATVVLLAKGRRVA